MFRKIIAFLKLGRLLFLSGGFIFYGLGAAMAAYEGVVIEWPLYIWGQLIVILSQLMVHYSNDYFDLAADQANHTYTRWSGGSRILPSGQITPVYAFIAALTLLTTALGLTLGLAITQSPPPLAIIALLGGIALSWGYSSPPMRLHSKGLGEISGVIVLTFLTPLVGLTLQTTTIPTIFWATVIPLAFLQFNMLVSVALPDAEGDAHVGKQTLVVQWGRPRMAWVYLMAMTAAFTFYPVGIGLFGLPTGVGLVAYLSLPLAVWLAWRIRPWQIEQSHWVNPRHWDSLAFFTIGLLMNIAFLQALAYVFLG